jgi:hypothetical protein
MEAFILGRHRRSRACLKLSVHLMRQSLRTPRLRRLTKLEQRNTTDYLYVGHSFGTLD